MIVIGAALAGAILGAMIARKRGGTRADIAQHAVAAAMALAVFGMVATVLIHRLAV